MHVFVRKFKKKRKKMERQKEERVFVKIENNSFHPWMQPVSTSPVCVIQCTLLISDDKLLSWDLNVRWHWNK